MDSPGCNLSVMQGGGIIQVSPVVLSRHKNMQTAAGAVEEVHGGE